MLGEYSEVVPKYPCQTFSVIILFSSLIAEYGHLSALTLPSNNMPTLNLTDGSIFFIAMELYFTDNQQTVKNKMVQNRPTANVSSRTRCSENCFRWFL